MRPAVCAALILLAGGVAARAQGDRGNLAVLEFRNKLSDRDRQEVDAGYFADVVRSAALREVPGLRVITRENLMVLLQSTAPKLEDCEGECEVETGRRIGADLVVSGDLLRVGSNYKLNLRLHETQGGQLVSGTMASGRTVDDLDANTTAAVHELLGPLRGGKRPVQAPLRAAPAPATALKPPLPAEAVPAESPAPVARKVGFGLVGASALLGAGSVVYALKSRSLMSDAQAATGLEIDQLTQDSHSASRTAWILGAAAAAAVVSGIVLVVLNPPETR